ncbi:MAG: nitroreductase [Candidatus Cloacimonetes bacterium]|nr:nitroreductase [Candidatus Cloacimonadota bacterium]
MIALFKYKFSNDIYEIIKTRRSIRSFNDKEVPDELLDKILQTAIWAPSGKNFQNWHFYVLKNEKLKDFTKVYNEFWEFVKPTLEGKLKPKIIELTGKFFGNIGNAPVVILAFSDIIPGEEPITSMGSVFLAIQNLLLLAHKEGLGTCVLGRVEQKAEQVKKLLNIENKEFLCGIALGYSNYERTPPAPPRKEGRIHWL